MDALTQFATTGLAEAWTFILNFLALIILAGALFAWSWRSGRDGLITLIFSLYVGYTLYFAFPYADSIILAGGSPLNELVLRVVFFGIFTGIAYWAISAHSSGTYFSAGHTVSIVLAVLASGFIMAVLYHSLDAKAAYSFTPSIDALFAPKDYFFWWFIAPLVGILALAR